MPDYRSSPYHDFPYTYRMTVQYDGTAYSGWQIQPQGLTIQSELQDALRTFFQEPVAVTGSGRTDTGVHAKGQVVHFRRSQPVDTHRLLRACNGLLARDIRVVEVCEAPAAFHARYSATGKIYHYHLHMNPVEDPFTRRYSWHMWRDVNTAALSDAAQVLVGTHDFSAFANEVTRGCAAKNPVRTMSRIDVVVTEEGVRLEFEANGFLYKMVRNIVGTLVELCSDKSIDPVETMTEILASKDRSCGGATAPPHGLFLMKVHYPEELLQPSSPHVR